MYALASTKALKRIKQRNPQKIRPEDSQDVVLLATVGPARGLPTTSGLANTQSNPKLS